MTARRIRPAGAGAPGTAGGPIRTGRTEESR
jgi:hypothetical protein